MPSNHNPLDRSRFIAEYFRAFRERESVDLAYSVLASYGRRADSFCRLITDEIEAKIVELSRLESEIARLTQERDALREALSNTTCTLDDKTS